VRAAPIVRNGRFIECPIPGRFPSGPQAWKAARPWSGDTDSPIGSTLKEKIPCAGAGELGHVARKSCDVATPFGVQTGT